MVSFFFPFLSSKFGSESSFLNWMGRIDTGIAALLLFILAAFKMEDKKFKNFLMFVFTFSLFMSFLGRMPFFEKLYEWIPLMKTMRYGSKINVIMFFILCLMAGYGFDLAAGGNREKTGKFSVFVNFYALLLLFVFIIAAVFKEPFLRLYRESFMPAADFQGVYKLVENYNLLLKQYIIYAAFVCGLAAVLALNREGFTSRKYAPVLMLAVSCAALFSYHTAGYDYFQKFSDVKEPTKTMKFLLDDTDVVSGSLRLLAPSEAGGLKGQISYADGKELLYCNKDKLLPNVVMPFKIYNADGFDSLEIDSFAGFRGLVSSSDKPWEAPVFSLFSVKYIAAIPKISGKYIRELFRGETGIYENINRVSRVYYIPLSADIRYTDSKDEIYEGLKRPDFHPLKMLYLEDKAREEFTADTGVKKSAPEISFKQSGLNRIDIKLISPEPGYAVINDNYYPGWTAGVNGVKRPVFRANSTFKAVRVETGENNITLKFTPLTVAVSFMASSAVMLALLIAALLRGFKAGVKP